MTEEEKICVAGFSGWEGIGKGERDLISMSVQRGEKRKGLVKVGLEGADCGLQDGRISGFDDNSIVQSEIFRPHGDIEETDFGESNQFSGIGYIDKRNRNGRVNHSL